MRKTLLCAAVVICSFCCAFGVGDGCAETLEQAVLRSGSVVGEHNIPSVLVAGESYRFTWMTQSYVPLFSWFQIKLPSGETEMIEATLERDEQGNYYISGQYSRNYYFYVDYTVPDDVGKARIGFYHSQDNDETSKRMYGLFPTGVIDRPVNEAGKAFYRNICDQGGYGGECVAYVRNYFGGDYSAMPGLCVHDDCGAYHAYDDWDLGSGKGKVPKINSIMVLDRTDGMPVGHVAVVVGIDDNGDGTFDLTVQESNWSSPGRIDCGVTYTYDAEDIQVSREGGAWLPLRGFIYSDAP